MDSVDSIISTFNALKKLKKRQLFHQSLNVALMVASAVMIWKSLILITNCESPITVVLSESMSPAFHRGDLIFLAMDEEPFEVGEIVVFKIQGKDIPIVHRILKIHEKEDGIVSILTKGDFNEVDDSFGIYAHGQQFLGREHIVGRVKGYLPYVGYVAILMNENPYVKFIFIGALGLYVLVTRE